MGIKSARAWQSWKATAWVGGLCLLAAACSVGGPYVYNRAAIDRDDPNFAKPYDPYGGVTVCHSKYNADPAEVARLAREICAASGFGIRFRETTYVSCSLTSPVGAVFDCINADGDPITRISARDAVGRRAAAKAQPGAMPGQPEAPQSGFREDARPLGILFGRPETPPVAR